MAVNYSNSFHCAHHFLPTVVKQYSLQVWGEKCYLKLLALLRLTGKGSVQRSDRLMAWQNVIQNQHSGISQLGGGRLRPDAQIKGFIF